MVTHRALPPHTRPFLFALLPAALLVAAAWATAQPTRQHDTIPGPGGGRARISALGRDLDAIIADRNFHDATWGVSVISCESGEVLYRHEAERNRQVASNIKLLTTAVAIERLGPDYRFTTSLLIDGLVDSVGHLNGNLIVRTSGDPSLAPGYGVDPRLVVAGWARSLDSLGIHTVENVIVDASALDATPFAPGWAWDDEPFGFSAPISAASIWENSIEVHVIPGMRPGDPVAVELHPTTGYVRLQTTAITTRSDSASTLDIRRLPGSATISVAGNIAVGSEPYVEAVSIDRPALFMATVIAEELERNEIEVRGRAVDLSDFPTPLDLSRLQVAAVYRSPRLAAMIGAINKQSLNLGAEMLLRALDRAAGGVGSTAGGVEQVRHALQRYGIDPEHLKIVDGSGLSRVDMISPADITALLRGMARSRNAEAYMRSLSIAGVDGTLSARLRGTLAEGNVYGKTGYLGGVRAISGYARTRDGELLAFSIATNNYSVPTVVVNTAHDLMIMRLASFTRKG